MPDGSSSAAPVTIPGPMIFTSSFVLRPNFATVLKYGELISETAAAELRGYPTNRHPHPSPGRRRGTYSCDALVLSLSFVLTATIRIVPVAVSFLLLVLLFLLFLRLLFFNKALQLSAEDLCEAEP